MNNDGTLYIKEMNEQKNTFIVLVSDISKIILLYELGMVTNDIKPRSKWLVLKCIGKK